MARLKNNRTNAIKILLLFLAVCLSSCNKEYRVGRYVLQENGTKVRSGEVFDGRIIREGDFFIFINNGKNRDKIRCERIESDISKSKYRCIDEDGKDGYLTIKSFPPKIIMEDSSGKTVVTYDVIGKWIILTRWGIVALVIGLLYLVYVIING